MRADKIFLFAFFFAISFYFHSQNESRHWRFGFRAGLDFGTSPPSVVLSNAGYFGWSSASISDKNGNLLFYTNSDTVWNSLNNVMANGTGISPVYSNYTAIVKRPGSQNIFYIFNVIGAQFPGLNYSIVDMSLAGGQGSVTVKGASVMATAGNGKLAVTKHCNGMDYWIISHENNNNNFRAYLLTSSGLSLTPVMSAVGTIHGVNMGGGLKVSPNGKKLAMNLISIPGGIELYDFDNNTGIISNPLFFGNLGNASGLEFSPDGTKLYGLNGNQFRQWNLCAGTNLAIIASQYSLVPTPSAVFQLMQLAVDGKIYVSYGGSVGSHSVLGVVNNPDVAGAGCNFVQFQQSIAPRTNFTSLPYFDNSTFRPVAPNFSVSTSFSLACQTASFNMPAINTLSNSSCALAGWSVTSLQWDFGDPLSGSANTSTLANPSHFYTSVGTYTAQLVLHYSCGGGTDTLRQIVNITQPCITVNSTSITCASLGSATVSTTGGVGPFSYTWFPTAQTNSVASGLSPGTYTIEVHDASNNSTFTATTVFTSLIPLTGSLSSTDSLTCFGASNGTATVNNLAGGSGNQTFLWTNGSLTYTNAIINNLSAGIWTVTVSDALTGCIVDSVFTISQPAALVLNIASNSPTTCVGSVLTLTANGTGGTGAYTYSWVGGANSSTHNVYQVAAGNYSYVVNAEDANNCFATDTIMIGFIPNPTISVNSVSICPLQTGTLSASGASSYTWQNNFTGALFADNPLVTTNYSVIGSALGCTATASASIILKAVPIPSVSNNSPICNGQTLTLNAEGGISYLWSGPQSYNTSIQNPIINNAAPVNSGVYNLTVTAANACTAGITSTVIVNPTPNIGVLSQTLCANQVLNLAANSFPGSSFLWTGPNSFSSTLQNPVINSVSIQEGGSYTVFVTSAESCTNLTSVDILVNPLPVLSVNSVSICPLEFGILNVSGATTYTWSDNSSGTILLDNPLVTTQYSVVGSALGCTSIATPSIILKPIPNIFISSNSPSCENTNALLNSSGGVSYSWNGPFGYFSNSQNPTLTAVGLSQSGIYNLTVTAANSCTAGASTTLIVNPIPAVTATGATVCTSQTLTLNSNSIPGAGFLWSGPQGFSSTQQNPLIANPSVNRSGLYFVRATSAQGCTNIATATASVIPPPSLTVALSSNSLCFQAFNGSPNTITLTSNGANSYTLFTPDLTGSGNPAGPSTTVSTMPPFSSTLVLGTATIVGSNGVCTNSVTRNYSIVPNPTVVITPTPVICAGKNYTYTSFGASSYVWNSSTPNFTTYHNGGVAVAHPSINSVFSVFGTSLGCNSASQTSTINIIPLPVINLIPQEPIICLYEKITLTANGTGTSFEWFPAEGLNNTVGMSVIASPQQTKNYTVVASANNCTNNANITVTVLALPQPKIINVKEKVCVDEIITLKGEGGVNFKWFGPQNIFYQGQEINFKAASIHFSGDYTLTVTDENGCKGNTIAPIVIQALPQGYLGGVKENVCVPYCGDFNFSSVILNSELTSTWQIGNQVITNNKFSYCFPESGTYPITGRIFDAKTTCSNSVSYQVKVNAKPQADFYFSPQKPVEGIDEVVFTNASIGEEQTKWNWFFHDEYKSKFQSENISYKFDNSGLYTIAMVVTNKWNCADTAIRTIQVETDFGMYIPNAFTPNNDGLNDEFKPVIRSAQKYNLKIFDRWGDLIFESNETEKGWDGTNRGGVNSKGGVYAWMIEVATLQGESKSLSGHVTLLR